MGPAGPIHAMIRISPRERADIDVVTISSPAPTSWSLAGRQSLLSILGRHLSRSRLLTAAALRVAFRFLLVVAGLGLLTRAAFEWNAVAGYTAAGICCLLLEWVIKR